MRDSLLAGMKAERDGESPSLGLSVNERGEVVIAVGTDLLNAPMAMVFEPMEALRLAKALAEAARDGEAMRRRTRQ